MFPRWYGVLMHCYAGKLHTIGLLNKMICRLKASVEVHFVAWRAEHGKPEKTGFNSGGAAVGDLV